MSCVLSSGTIQFPTSKALFSLKIPSSISLQNRDGYHHVCFCLCLRKIVSSSFCAKSSNSEYRLLNSKALKHLEEYCMYLSALSAFSQTTWLFFSSKVHAVKPCLLLPPPAQKAKSSFCPNQSISQYQFPKSNLVSSRLQKITQLDAMSLSSLSATSLI